ncbi:MAG: HD domain-containing phosphohydrolase [Pirellulaceae bacterium]
MPAADRSALFYTLLLKDLGCSSNAAKMCWLFGADDRQVKHDLKTINWSRMTESFKFAWRSVAPGSRPLQRALKFAAMMRQGPEGARKLVETRCERGADITRMLQLPEATAEGIRSLDEHWDGSGHPSRLWHEEIPLFSRIAGIAQTFEVFLASEGLSKAYAVLRERRGTWFDPKLVDDCMTFQGDAGFWNVLASDRAREELSRWEPRDEVRWASEEDFDRICLAFAQVVDAKSPWTFRHSQGVAEIAVGIARSMGYDEVMLRDIRRAGLLHDIGKLGVSNLILDKPGKPTDEEFVQIRKHPDYTERILRQVGSFSSLADVAASHHERLDGRGYHRRLNPDRFPALGQLLAVADIFEALSAKRPYRDAMPREKIYEILDRDAGVGLCADCIVALKTSQEQNATVSRVESQLDAIEQLVQQI